MKDLQRQVAKIFRLENDEESFQLYCNFHGFDVNNKELRAIKLSLIDR